MTPMNRSGSTHDVVVIGESLIDIVRSGDGSHAEIVGGSPANVALGLGRLGGSPQLVTALGEDGRGRRIARHLEASGVAIHPGSWSLERTATAAATVGPDGSAAYEFDIPWQVPQDIRFDGAHIVHTGSIAAFVEPGAVTVRDAIARAATHAIVTFDPNIRPTLVGDHGAAVEQVLRLARHAHVVKLSDEDAAWLWPNRAPEQVADMLLENGPSLVAITLGGEGAIAATRSARAAVAAPAVEVVDTVGAGDTFMAALIHRVAADRSLVAHPSEGVLEQALVFATTAAAITVQRTGADLPDASDVSAALSRRFGSR
ncbi:carbohydrate kinase family protein [Microbacterium sp. KNMS]